MHLVSFIIDSIKADFKLKEWDNKTCPYHKSTATEMTAFFSSSALLALQKKKAAVVKALFFTLKTQESNFYSSKAAESMFMFFLSYYLSKGLKVTCKTTGVRCNSSPVTNCDLVKPS